MLCDQEMKYVWVVRRSWHCLSAIEIEAEAEKQPTELELGTH